MTKLCPSKHQYCFPDRTPSQSQDVLHRLTGAKDDEVTGFELEPVHPRLLEWKMHPNRWATPLNGIFSYFNCRAISADEMKNWRKYKVVESTPLAARWDPYNPVYQEEEDAMLDGRGEVLEKTPDRAARFDLIERDHWEREMGLQSCYCEPMSVHEYEGLIARTSPTFPLW